ncbi:MAG: GerMN domain-containing protein [Candidatus Nanopelagicaceae bacterium]|nr:GerMN domain-containing protein [Candidatus Nanopelagicaceae bacterium]
MKSRKYVAFVGISALVAAIVLTGCGKETAPTPTPTPTPTQTGTPTPTPTPTPTFSGNPSPTRTSGALAQYWVADTARGFRLYREFLGADFEPDALTAALTNLVSKKPVDPDYVSLWPADTKINSVKVVGNLATIDLTFSKLNVGGEGESLAIAQLVWTATAANYKVTRVAITRDGKTVESLAGHVDATKPFTRGPAYAVVAPVWITYPGEGNTAYVDGFTLEGMASTFEANVAWKVYKDGKLVKQGSATAAEAGPAWTKWSVKIPGLSPGEYLFTAAEYSAKDGSLVAQDTHNAILE